MTSWSQSLGLALATCFLSLPVFTVVGAAHKNLHFRVGVQIIKGRG